MPTKRMRFLSVCCLAICLCLAPAGAGAQQKLYVATTGLDSNPGTIDQPLLTLSAAVGKLLDQGTILVAPGTYPVKYTLPITKTGVTIMRQNAVAPVLQFEGTPGAIFDVRGSSARIEGFVLDGQFKTGSRAVMARNTSSLLNLSSCEIKRFANSAVWLDGADCKVGNCQIHHILWWDAAKGAQPAHGIITTSGQRTIVQNCQIYQVSGSSIFGAIGNWSDLTVDACTCYDLPLESAMGGFQQGVKASASGLATLHAATVPRAKLIVSRSTFLSFRSSFGPSSALDLEGQIDAVVDSCDLSNSAVALLVRGNTNNTGAWVAGFNCTIRTSDVGISYVNSPQNLRLTFDTFDQNTVSFSRSPAGAPGGTGWLVIDNLFSGASSLPPEAPPPLNVIPAPGTLNPSLIPLTAAGILGTPPPPQAVPVWYRPITTDKAGVLRSTTSPTMGAYEFQAGNIPPGQHPPVPPPITTNHPRLFSGQDLAAKVAADPSGIWKAIIAAAEAAPASPTANQIAERMAACAAIYRFGLIPGFTYKKTQAAYGDQAAADFAAWDMSVTNYTNVKTYSVHLACTYDWAFQRLTAAQVSAFIQNLANFRANIIGSGTKPPPNNGWELWWGYDIPAGAIMLVDLAVHGDGGPDWVTDTYLNAWWNNDPNKQNWFYFASAFPHGSHPQGFDYWGYNYSGTVNFAKTAYAQLTGDHSADELDVPNYPRWMLFQTDPNLVKGKFLWGLPTMTYSGGDGATWAEVWYQRLAMETPGSDPTRAALARWLLDQTKGYGFGFSALNRLISYLLVGDPRVAGQSPSALGLPLSFNTDSEVFQRSDWTPQASVVYFGCAKVVSRVSPSNDFMLWSKGQPLLLQRQRIYRHQYSPGALHTMPIFYSGNQIVGEDNHDGPNSLTVVGSLKSVGATWTGEAQKLYRSPTLITFPLSIQLARRSMTYQHPTIQVLDEIQCDAALTPHICWNMPTEPVLSRAGQAVQFTSGQHVQADSVTIVNGPASCVMTFGAALEVIPIGGTDENGVIHWVDGLDGVPMDVSGKPTTSPDIDPNFVKLPLADQLKVAGFWRIQCVLPNGGATVSTTIQIQ